MADREQERDASRVFGELLRARLEANRGITLEDLMGRGRDQEADAPEQEDGHES